MNYPRLLAAGLTVLVCFATLASAEGQRPDWVEAIPQSRMFSGDALQMGQTVVRGKRQEDGQCVYDPFLVVVSNPVPGFSRKLILAPDIECRLQVIGRSVEPIRLREKELRHGDGLVKQIRAGESTRTLQPAVLKAEGPRLLRTFSPPAQPEYHVVGTMRVIDPVGLILTRNSTQFKFKEDPPACPTGTVCITQSFLPDCYGSTFNALDCHITTQDPPAWQVFYGSTSEFQCVSAANPFCRNPVTQEFIPWNHRLLVTLRGRVDGASDCIFATQGAVPGVLINSCDCN